MSALLMLALGFGAVWPDEKIEQAASVEDLPESVREAVLEFAGEGEIEEVCKETAD